MTSRQTGRRLRRMTGQRSRVRAEKRKASGETRRFVQLMACGGIFVFLVAAKLLLPARMAEFNERLSVLMAQNVDVQAVFSAVGRAFSGEDPAGAAEEVYEAVFHPQTQPAVKNRPLRLHDGGALETLRLHRPAPPESPEPENSAAPEDTPGSLPEDSPATADTSGSLPEDSLTTEDTPDSLPEDPGGAEPDPANMAYVLYSEENLPEGVSMEQAILDFDYTTPVMGVLTSDFGYREHPIEGEERFHYGIDLAANSGTEIDCFADGTVTAAGESSSYGKYCIVGHAGGYSTLYAHCSRIVVTSGTPVSRGQKIAEVGETGMATGPHLHFELHQDGGYLNPIYYVSTQ